MILVKACGACGPSSFSTTDCVDDDDVCPEKIKFDS